MRSEDVVPHGVAVMVQSDSKLAHIVRVVKVVVDCVLRIQQACGPQSRHDHRMSNGETDLGQKCPLKTVATVRFARPTHACDISG